MSGVQPESGFVSRRLVEPQPLADFGFSDRQARFLTLVLKCSGVFVERQYCAFAGIVHGQKSHDFVERLVSHELAREIRPGALHRGRMYHVHHKALYKAIGEPDNRHRRRAPVPRLVERLMLLDAVMDDRRPEWLLTERDKLRHFMTVPAERRLERRELPHLAFGRGPNRTLRMFPEKLPIGLEAGGWEYVFLYLLTKRSTTDFRAFLIRHFMLLTTSGRWTLRVLVPRPFAKAIRLHEHAFREEVARPIAPSDPDEIRWYFQQLRLADGASAKRVDPRFVEAERRFGGPRFRLLYRLWTQCGDDVVWNLGAPHVRDKLERGEARLEFVVLNRQYLHLSHLVGIA